MTDELRSHRPPRSPRAAIRWCWYLVRDVVDEYRYDGVGDLAAAITFWTILSVPAALLALVSALSSTEALIGESLAADVEAEIEGFLEETFVDAEPLTNTVQELWNTSSTGIATVATLVAFFTLSRAFAGLIRALDVAYEVEEGRPFWYLRIVAIGLGLGTIAVVAAGTAVLAVLPELSLGGFRWLTAGLVLAALIVWAATLFHLGPYHRTPWRYDLPGAFVTAFGWIASSQIFALYVRFAGNGNNLQSSVGAVLLALTLLYVLSVVLLVGAEVNDVIARRAGVVRELNPVTQRARRAGERAWQLRARSRRQSSEAESSVDGSS